MKIVSNTNILEQSMYCSMIDVMTNNNLNMFESNTSTNGLYECISKAASIYKNNDGSRINFILDANDLTKHGSYDIDEVEESIPYNLTSYDGTKFVNVINHIVKILDAKETYYTKYEGDIFPYIMTILNSKGYLIGAVVCAYFSNTIQLYLYERNN